MITESMIDQYAQDGALCVRQAIPEDAAARLLEHLDTLINSQDDRWTTIRAGGFSDRHLWPSHPWMYEFCARSDLPEIAALLMRSKTVRLYFDHTFVREAGTRQSTPWHQDIPYWPFRGTQVASVWVALTHCNSESSGLRFVKGSHSWGKTYRPIAFSKDSGSAQFLDKQYDLEQMPDFDAPGDEYEILTWEMRPGDAIVFGAAAVHSAAGNADSDHRRAAISVRYVGDDARWDPRPGTDPIVTQDQVSIQPGDAPSDDRWFPQVYCS
jgi:ectoine hydroxylase-related dioxygenase (phytanoyl-CoA dioxygenase family)